eukprot:TRINITY_DN3128_c0_g1_i1.p1 TRINITY_DN3128_c0_g1~~TRINITY_DN3128_c0_g1_i1.p1  ORF type:complete len:818 (+),score=222.25 TRINITY_DN3128_c0_g1_i1:167-2620(+)
MDEAAREEKMDPAWFVTYATMAGERMDSRGAWRDGVAVVTQRFLLWVEKRRVKRAHPLEALEELVEHPATRSVLFVPTAESHDPYLLLRFPPGVRAAGGISPQRRRAVSHPPMPPAGLAALTGAAGGELSRFLDTLLQVANWSHAKLISRVQVETAALITSVVVAARGKPAGYVNAGRKLLHFRKLVKEDPDVCAAISSCPLPAPLSESHLSAHTSHLDVSPGTAGSSTTCQTHSASAGSAEASPPPDERREGSETTLPAATTPGLVTPLSPPRLRPSNMLFAAADRAALSYLSCQSDHAESYAGGSGTPPPRHPTKPTPLPIKKVTSLAATPAESSTGSGKLASVTSFIKEVSLRLSFFPERRPSVRSSCCSDSDAYLSPFSTSRAGTPVGQASFSAPVSPANQPAAAAPSVESTRKRDVFFRTFLGDSALQLGDDDEAAAQAAPVDVPMVMSDGEEDDDSSGGAAPPRAKPAARSVSVREGSDEDSPQTQEMRTAVERELLRGVFDVGVSPRATDAPVRMARTQPLNAAEMAVLPTPMTRRGTVMPQWPRGAEDAPADANSSHLSLARTNTWTSGMGKAAKQPSLPPTRIGVGDRKLLRRLTNRPNPRGVGTGLIRTKEGYADAAGPHSPTPLETEYDLYEAPPCLPLSKRLRERLGVKLETQVYAVCGADRMTSKLRHQHGSLVVLKYSFLYATDGGKVTRLVYYGEIGEVMYHIDSAYVFIRPREAAAEHTPSLLLKLNAQAEQNRPGPLACFLGNLLRCCNVYSRNKLAIRYIDDAELVALQAPRVLAKPTQYQPPKAKQQLAKMKKAGTSH